MKTYHLLIGLLTPLFLLTACSKETILPDQQIDNQQTRQKFDGLLVHSQILEFEILAEGRALQDARIETENPEIACEEKIRKKDQELQQLANRTCETQYGGVKCEINGGIIYAMLATDPQNDCGIAVPNEEDFEEEPITPSYVIDVKIKATQVRGGGYQLSAYAPRNADPNHFNADIFIVTWTKDGRTIGNGAQLRAIIHEGKVQVQVSNLATNQRGKATITIQDQHLEQIIEEH